MSPLIAVDDVSVDRGGETVLRDVAFDVDAGEFVALVGPNGAGKSTLLSVISGDVAATRGEVRVDGRRVDAWSAPDLARRRAVLPQAVTVAFPFSVDEVVRMGRAPYHRTPAAADDDAVIAAAMEELAIADLRNRRHPSLSGGEQARVAIARVFAQTTPTLLLDEPTAALDVRFQELALRGVADRVAQGAAAVVVLHDLALAAAYATRIVLLARGRVVADGAPAAVLTASRLTEVYEHPIAVVPHPHSDCPLVLPER